MKKKKKLTPEQLKEFTKKVLDITQKDWWEREYNYSGESILAPIWEGIIIIKHKTETINVPELIKKKKLPTESEN